MPYLQVQDAAGAWKTVNRDMGMPAGKPKTIVVPVEFLSASRKVRIVTNLCVYWDEIFLSEGASDAQVKPALDTFRLRRSAFSRILGNAHSPAAQTARYILLRSCFAGFLLESHSGPLYQVRPGGQPAARRRRSTGDHGFRRRSDSAVPSGRSSSTSCWNGPATSCSRWTVGPRIAIRTPPSLPLFSRSRSMRCPDIRILRANTSRATPCTIPTSAPTTRGLRRCYCSHWSRRSSDVRPLLTLRHRASAVDP